MPLANVAPMSRGADAYHAGVSALGLAGKPSDSQSDALRNPAMRAARRSASLMTMSGDPCRAIRRACFGQCPPSRAFAPQPGAAHGPRRLGPPRGIARNASIAKHPQERLRPRRRSEPLATASDPQTHLQRHRRRFWASRLPVGSMTARRPKVRPARSMALRERVTPPDPAWRPV